MKNLLMMLFFIIAFSNSVFTQSVLDKYIQIGLENNLALKQKEFSLQKSLAALKEAQGLFLPSIGINARYTRAEGGRAIEFPVGDMLNPVYQTLNQMLGQQLFPTINNEKINFLRTKEHETKIEIVQPIFQPEIYYNYEIRWNLSEVERAERNVFARALIADIKTAYYNFLITENVVQILSSTEEILKENLRVSESLFKNDKVTIDVVYRAQAEQSELEQKKQEAITNNMMARAYLNFILNRDQDAYVEQDTNEPLPVEINYSLDESISLALGNREELDQLNYAKEIASNSIRLGQSGYLPRLLAAANYGFQGEEYKFTKDDDFWSASLVLQWNLFRGFQDELKIEQAEIDKKTLVTRQLELENKIRLQTREAYYNLTAAGKSIDAAKARILSTKKSFEIVNKKFNEGMASQIEFLDSRTSMTNAALNYAVTKYQQLISQANFEKVVANNLITLSSYERQK